MKREYIIKNGRYYSEGSIKSGDIRICGGLITEIGQNLHAEKGCIAGENEASDKSGETAETVEIDAFGLITAPGFCDLHVHLREPGFEYKETVRTGTMAAARGGYTTVCAMPNLRPVPDSAESLQTELDIINRDAVIEVLPFASITKAQQGRELSDIEAVSGKCCGFSDDGKGVQSREMMREAMERVSVCGGFISAHCEDESLLVPKGAVHDGFASQKYGVPGISSASEYVPVWRDIELAAETGCKYHICHISAKESLAYVREAKSRGLNVTCEVTPHHAALSDRDITEDNGKFKMNPPLRTEADRSAIWEAIEDGTADCIATDHAPHSEEEKSKGLGGSAFGIVGLETAFAVMNTFTVKTGRISLERLLAMMCDNPRKVLGDKCKRSDIAEGVEANLVLISDTHEHVVDSGSFVSTGHSTPFDGMNLIGDIAATFYKGAPVYINDRIIN